jgi:hypothetical protein
MHPCLGIYTNGQLNPSSEAVSNEDTYRGLNGLRQEPGLLTKYSDQTTEWSIPGGGNTFFSSPQRPTSLGGSFPAYKTTWAVTWLPSSAEIQQCMELYLHYTHTLPWRGSRLSSGITVPSPGHNISHSDGWMPMLEATFIRIVKTTYQTTRCHELFMIFFNDTFGINTTWGLIILWRYKENKLRDWKNVFTLHIPPELHKVMTSLF